MPYSPADLQTSLYGQPSEQLARIEQLDNEIGRLSAHLNAANCRLLELIVEFDELGGWGDHGALILKALEAAVASLDDNVSAVTSDAPARGGDGIPQRRADALALMAETFLARGAHSVSGGDKHQVIVIADAGVMSGESEAGECCVEHGPNIAMATLRRLGCGASRRYVQIDEAGEPINIGRKSRTIPPPMRRALLLRDGGCRFPGCNHTRFVDGHHIVHLANGGETSLENVVTLCRRHHRLVHEGGFNVSRVGANQFQFTSPRGNVVTAAAPPPDAVRNLDTAIESLNEKLDLTVDDNTLGLWDGGTLNYSEAVENLQILDGQFRH